MASGRMENIPPDDAQHANIPTNDQPKPHIFQIKSIKQSTQSAKFASHRLSLSHNTCHQLSIDGIPSVYLSKTVTAQRSLTFKERGCNSLLSAVSMFSHEFLVLLTSHLATPKENRFQNLPYAGTTASRMQSSTLGLALLSQLSPTKSLIIFESCLIDPPHSLTP